MTVAELIAELSKFAPETRVFAVGSDEEWDAPSLIQEDGDVLILAGRAMAVEQ